jgi:tRNA (adenine57-N1/adenine58-N1)-methyltransferase
MTIALAYAVGPQGRVITYEKRPEFSALARKNLARVGLDERVVFNVCDLLEGCQEVEADAFFLDVPNPWEYISQVRSALKAGGFFGSLLPTFNQVENLLRALRQWRFAFVEVCEILLRYYKPEPSRLRPTDRMVAHTGYLIFARKIEPSEDGMGREILDEVLGMPLDDGDSPLPEEWRGTSQTQFLEEQGKYE